PPSPRTPTANHPVHCIDSSKRRAVALLGKKIGLLGEFHGVAHAVAVGIVGPRVRRGEQLPKLPVVVQTVLVDVKQSTRSKHRVETWHWRADVLQVVAQLMSERSNKCWLLCRQVVLFSQIGG